MDEDVPESVPFSGEMIMLDTEFEGFAGRRVRLLIFTTELTYITAPICHGMNSRSPKPCDSDLDGFPLATSNIRSNIS